MHWECIIVGCTCILLQFRCGDQARDEWSNLKWWCRSMMILLLNNTLFILLFWQLSIDLIHDVDEWQTIPGYCILVFRMVIMIYFLYELQNTFSIEDSQIKRDFYTRFGAGYLVWFIYLPIVALVSPKIATLWRFKTLLSEFHIYVRICHVILLKIAFTMRL